MTNSRTDPVGHYSPQRRTALVLAGTGTAGAYQAGVLHALKESGVKIDVVAGCGVGAATAVFAAIDAGGRLWDRDGVWRAPEAARFYQWRRSLRVAGWALVIALASVLVPLFALVAGLFAYPLSFLGQVLGIPGSERLIAGYSWLMDEAFQSGVLPTILPRVALVGLTVLVVTLLVVHLRRGRSKRRERRSGIWWAVLGAPVSAAGLREALQTRLWRVIAGAPGKKEPRLDEFGRRYTELLAESLGQPGFHELLLTVHDLDARRDLVFALLDRRRRRDFTDRPPEAAVDRAAELFDLSGVARDHLMEVVCGALALPAVTDAHLATFAPESYWRGETHRFVARPEAVGRLLEELQYAGVEQVIVVSAAGPLSGPHGLRKPRRDAWGRLGEWLAASDAVAVRDAVAARAPGFAALFRIEPSYNALANLDFRGCYDERSDRRQALAELVDRGYEDAYRQFIEPIVAGGDQAVEGEATAT